MTAPATPGDSARSRDKLARKWAYLISSSSYVPLSRDDIVSTLLDLVTGLAAAVRTEPADPTAVAKIGARLVELNCVDENSLRLTLDLLGKGLLNQPDLRALDHVAERVVSVLSSFTSGYVEALRLSIFDQQENINQALIKVTRDAQRSLSASEARFDEVFARVTSGMAITDLTGAFVRTNRALREILDRRQSEFTKITLFELIPDDEQYSLRQSLDALVRGRTERVEERRTMLRSDGETVRPVLMLSLLRSLDGQPSHYMIVVADDTELSLLQR
ncbi:MAG: PAS domain S-box protein, partial [Kutzneria sp.]|nr:PAS domain S-box protein [Kutzneria sp.]